MEIIQLVWIVPTHQMDQLIKTGVILVMIIFPMTVFRDVMVNGEVAL